MNRQYTKGAVYMSKGFMKRWSDLLVILGMRIKAINMTWHVSEWHKFVTQVKPSADKEVGQKEVSETANVIVNYFKPSWKQNVNI